MAVPTSFADLSTTPGSNSPAGSENVFPNLDDYIRFINAALASIKANTATNGWVSPYIAGTGSWAIPGAIGSATPNTGAFTTLTATDGSGIAALSASNLGSGTVPAARLSTATTPAQFDNDTSIATTAFVQQALGNHSGYATYSTSTTIATADLGKFIIVPNGTGSISLALPVSAPAGTRLVVYNNTAASTVTLTSTSSITSGSYSGASITITTGQVFDLVTDGSNNWVVAQGDPGRQAKFAASLATSGYQYLPSGLILQWGTTASIGLDSSLAVTFPVAFPTAALSVQTTGRLGSTTAGAGYSVGTGAYTTSGFTIYNDSNAQTVAWFAVGY